MNTMNTATTLRGQPTLSVARVTCSRWTDGWTVAVMTDSFDFRGVVVVDG
jgi:hypothetical protein